MLIADRIPIPVPRDDDELEEGGTDCSLREAVKAADTNNPVEGCDGGDAGPALDTIELAAANYPVDLGSPGSGEDLNATGDLDIGGDEFDEVLGRVLTIGAADRPESAAHHPVPDAGVHHRCHGVGIAGVRDVEVVVDQIRDQVFVEPAPILRHADQPLQRLARLGERPDRALGKAQMRQCGLLALR